MRIWTDLIATQRGQLKRTFKVSHIGFRCHGHLLRIRRSVAGPGGGGDRLERRPWVVRAEHGRAGDQ
jgi:hypothetical protein